MANSLSPAFMRVRYNSAGHDHVMTLPTKFVGTPTPGVEPNLRRHDGSSITASDFAADFLPLLSPFFHSGDALGSIDIWSQPLPEDDPVFIYSVPSAVTGGAAGADVVAVQTVFTFRTVHRGGFRLVLMEGTNSADNQANWPFGGSGATYDLASYIIGDSCPIYARNNDAPAVPLKTVSKENDVLRRKYKI